MPAIVAVNTFLDVVDPGDGLTSLREAIAQAANPLTHAGADTIVLPHEIGGVAGTYALSLGQLSVLDATGKLTIMSDGGPATVDAQGVRRVFEVFAGSEAVFQGLTITGGSADHGAGILNNGTATITDSTLSGNSAKNGGGLYNLGTATVADSVFSGNSTTGFGGGGGVWNDLGTVTITDCTFSGNSTGTGFGAGILNSATATITGCTFSGNSADAGGGILNFGTVTITGSTFSGNSGTTFGGGIDNDGTATITDSTISENEGGYGGGIHNDGAATLTITGSTISRNKTPSHDGGGIWNSPFATLIVTACNLTENTSPFGGAIYNHGTATITDTTLDGNTADYGGGILNHGTVTVATSLLSGNVAVLHDGGAIWNGPAGMVAVTGSTLAQNSAGFGAGLYNHGKATVTDSTLEGNTADYGGGILNHGTATVAASTLGDNTAVRNGGGIWNGPLGTLHITTGSTVIRNAGEVGGGLYNLGAATIAESDLRGNHAVLGTGGGVYNGVGGTLDVTASSVGDNVSEIGGGGGIDNLGAATITASSVSDNSAQFAGGILNFEVATLTVTGSTVSGNSVAFGGGGIYNVAGAELTVTASDISGNSADHGGGIWIDGRATITGSTISGNTGEGVYIDGSRGSQLLGNTINDNSKSGVLVIGTNYLIGSPLAGNTIAFNGEAGVVVALGSGMAIRGNAIYGNAGLGIDLGVIPNSLTPDGVTPNDPGDTDVGPNRLQNAPVLVLATSAAAGTTLSGTLNSAANTRFLIDVYATPPAGSPLGMIYIGSGLVLTDSGGNVDFTVTLPTTVAPGWGITATATTTDAAPFGDTSEFALGIPVFASTPPNQPPVVRNQTFNVGENQPSGTVVGTVAASDPNAGQTLSYQITAGNDLGAFAIDGGTGRVTVANGALLDFETRPVFTLTVQVTDNGAPALSSTATVTINLQNVNEAPVNSVPSFPQSVAKNDTLTFASASGNAIQVSDPDAGPATIQVSLTVLHGKLTLARTTGLSFLVGDGTSDGTMTFRGTAASINAALSGLQYTPDKNYEGPDSLAIATNDLGSGIGGPLMDADSVSILVENKKKPKVVEDKKPKDPEDKKPKVVEDKTPKVVDTKNSK